MAAKLTQKTTDNAIAYYRESITMLKRVDGRFRRKQEIRLRTKLQRTWARQIKWLLKEMQELPQFNEGVTASGVQLISRKQFDRQINDLVDRMPYNDDVVEAVEISARASYVKGGRRTYNQFKLGALGMSFEIVNEGAVEYLRALTTLN